MSHIVPHNQQDDTDVETLFATLAQGDDNTRAASAKSLGERGDQQAVELLIAALNDFYWHVRCNAAEALGKIADVRAVEPLIANLRHLDTKTQAASAKALGELGDRRAVDALAARLGRGPDSVSTASAEALEKLGGSAIVMAWRKTLVKRSQGVKIMQGGWSLFVIGLIVQDLGRLLFLMGLIANRSVLDITNVASPISDFLLLLALFVITVGFLRWWFNRF